MAIQQMLTTDQQKAREAMESLLAKPSSASPSGRATAGAVKIKKIGHCCLIIETKGVRIMTDPGSFTTAQDQEQNIDIIVISHEHGDHFHVESLQNVLANNPEAKIITNTAVGKLLDEKDIAYEVLEHGNSTTIKDIAFEAFGERHAEIYGDMGQVQNTGYFIDDTLFYPGDALTNPERPIDILALPTAGPFLKFKEVVEYALLLKPKRAFPVHDAIMKNPSMFNQWVGSIISQQGIEFVSMNDGDEKEF